MKYSSFLEDRIRQQVEEALVTVRKILHTNRAPVFLAEDVQDHVYQDKYALAELLTNTSLAAHLTVLQRMGLSAEHLSTIAKWMNNENKAVTLRFSSEDSCSFVKEQEVNVVNHEVETEVTLSSTTTPPAAAPAPTGRIWGGAPTTSTVKNETIKAKVMSKVREYHWKITFGYKLVLFPGTDPSRSIELQSRESSTILITTIQKKQGPLPEHTVHPAIDVDLTWFFRMISADQQRCRFTIDRSNPDTCVTPRRNSDVQEAIEFYQVFSQSWARSVEYFMHQRVEAEILGQHAPAAPPPKITPPGLGHVTTNGIFSPTLPLLQQRGGSADAVEADHSPPAADSRLPPLSHATEKSPLLSTHDYDEFLQEHARSLDEAFITLSKSYPPKQLVKLVSVAEASLVLQTKHLQELAQQYIDSMEYMELMLRQQLIAAIGKVVRPHDFNQFMSFHFQRLFNSQFAPKPFMYAIRRPLHYPDGFLSIEVNTDDLQPDQKQQPVETMVRHIPGGEGVPPICIPINAATRLEITGDRYLHGWIQHRFSSASRHDFQLVARARQFSSFLLMVGTMAGPAQFEPQDAIILQNKDEVLIPLLLNELPTAKEFRDAISSLSPEQQRFAQSFRNMQLESSVFGMCVVQLKPQLEALLGLPADSLTKEIQLTEDLLSFFMEYQIPSDLVSFDGPIDATTADKVAAVKGHVKSVMDVLENAKKKQLEDEVRKADMRSEMAHSGTTQEESAYSSSFGFSPGGGGVFLAAAAATAPSARMSRSSRGFGSPIPPAPMAMMAARDMPRAPMMFKDQLHGEAFSMEANDQQQCYVDTLSSSLRSSAVVPVATSKPSTAGHSAKPVSVSDNAVVDFTMIPKVLDTKFEQHDTDSALRATIIKAARSWTRLRQENLLTKAKESVLSLNDIRSEKNKALDLLDALSRSGSLPIACAELHVVVAVTHCFEDDVMDTVIMRNINPIEKVEKSSLLIASTIYGTPDVRSMLRENPPQVARLEGAFPALFGDAVASENSSSE